MPSALRDLPFVVLLIGLSGLAMLGPALHAVSVGDEATSRAFLYSGLITLVLFAMLAVATSGTVIRRRARSHLITIGVFFTLIPALLAIPFAQATSNTGFDSVYLDMVSALTTTGLPVYETTRIGASVHLWRAEVAWLGGFFMWVVAVSVFAPLNLGGFEVGSGNQVGQGATLTQTQIHRVADPAERLARFTRRFLPVYAGLTGLLWLLLIAAGDRPFVALCHAMSTMATSGISPVGGIGGSGSGYMGEVVVFVFFAFALSRLTFSSDDRTDGVRTLVRDPELRLGLSLIALLPVLLFVRHFVAAIEADGEIRFAEGLSGFWGALFTTASYLTTTGFESRAWGATRIWSGLETPGLILMGLAVFGGGVATTAGGVKLLRVYALYKHGLRELEKLVQPSSVGGAGQVARRFRRQGAYVAWIFFMLFAISIATVMAALSLFGIDFERALVLTIATLSTTGPLVVSASDPIDLISLGLGAKLILAAAMALGRLETLALIALLNPDFWRA